MPDFNPDEYLKKSEVEFNPEAYLSDQEKKDKNKKAYKEKTAYDKPVTSFLRGVADTATLGYLPQIEAGSRKLADKVAGTIYENTGLLSDSPAAVVSRMKKEGYDIDLPDYTQLRDESVREGEKLKKYNPKSSLGGMVAGGLLSAPLIAGGGAASVGGRLGQAALSGGALGALYNPGDREGEISPLQLQDRAVGAATGAAGGLVGQGLGELAKAAGKAIPENLKSFAREKAFKSSGAMLKDFKKAVGKDKLDELGETMFKEKLFKPGKSFDYVADQSSEKLDEVGKKIGDVYKKIGVQPIDQRQIYDDIVGDVIKNRPRVGGDVYDAKVQAILDDLIQDPSFKSGDIRGMNDFVREIDNMIDYSKRANEMKSVQQGYLSIKNKVRSLINKIAEDTGSPELKDLNKRYSNLIQINKIANDRVAREASNRAFGLTDTIAGSGGVGVGLLSGETPEDKIKNAIIYGGLLGGGNKLMRSYGTPAAASAARGLGGLLERNMPEIPRALMNPNTLILPRGLLEDKKKK